MGVSKDAPSIIVTSILGFDWDPPLSIDQDVKLDFHRFAPASRNLKRFASRGLYEICTMGVMSLVIIGPRKCPMLIGNRLIFSWMHAPDFRWLPLRDSRNLDLISPD